MPFFVPAGGYLELTDVQRVIGSDSGDANTGNNVFMAMAGAGDNNTGDRVIAIGVNAGADNVGADLIAIGENAGGGAGAGLITGSNICIGNNAMQTAVDATRNVVIGHSAVESIILQANQDFIDNVIIGNRALRNLDLATFSLDTSVIIGSEAGENINPTGGGSGGSVLIGFRAGRGTAAVPVSILNSVIIGHSAALKARTGGVSTVIIGFFAGEELSTGTENTLVGANAGQEIRDGSRNVMIGQGAGLAFNSGNFDNVIIGQIAAGQLGGRDGSRNTIIGADAHLGPNTAGDDCIVIGARANTPSFAGSRNLSENLLIETATTGSRKTYLLALAQAGNASFILGNNNVGSGVGTAEDLTALIAGGAVNILKLVNGADAGATNPVAGGYFYVSAGALHWVGSAGTDTALAVA